MEIGDTVLYRSWEGWKKGFIGDFHDRPDYHIFKSYGGRRYLISKGYFEQHGELKLTRMVLIEKRWK